MTIAILKSLKGRFLITEKFQSVLELLLWFYLFNKSLLDILEVIGIRLLKLNVVSYCLYGYVDELQCDISLFVDVHVYIKLLYQFFCSNPYFDYCDSLSSFYIFFSQEFSSCFILFFHFTFIFCSHHKLRSIPTYLKYINT